MFTSYRARWIWGLLLFLGGAVGTQPYAQSQTRESTLPELEVTRVAGKDEPPGWSRFSFGEPALFTAVFPHLPQQATNGSSRKNTSSGSWAFFAADDTALYQIVWTVSDTSSMTRSEKDKLQDYVNFAAGFFDGLAKGGNVSGGEISAERRIRSSGIEGFERETVFKDHESRFQMFHVGKAWLTLVSVWNSDNQLKNRNAFFESVKLEKGASPADAPALKSPIDNWKRYQIGTRASIMLPSKPAEETKPLKVAKSSTLGTYYRLNNPDYYSIAVLPDVSFASAQMSAPERESLFQQAWRSLAERIRKELSRSANPEKLHMTALPDVQRTTEIIQEREFRIGRLYGHARIILNAETVYVVMAFWTLETPLAVRDAFFESFLIESPLP